MRFASIAGARPSRSLGSGLASVTLQARTGWNRAVIFSSAVGLSAFFFFVDEDEQATRVASASAAAARVTMRRIMSFLGARQLVDLERQQVVAGGTGNLRGLRFPVGLEGAGAIALGQQGIASHLGIAAG